jgi:hypothetical protein
VTSFLVINQHAPDECEAISPGIEGAPAHLKGTKFLCPCPYGEHSFYMVVEGTTAEEVIQGLPREMRPGTRAVAIEILDL